MYYISDKLGQNVQIDNKDYSAMFKKLKKNVEAIKEDEREEIATHQSTALGMISDPYTMEISLFKKASYSDLSKSLDDLIDLKDFLHSIGAEDGEYIALDKVPIHLKRYFEYSSGKDLLIKVKSCKESRGNMLKTCSRKTKLFF